MNEANQIGVAFYQIVISDAAFDHAPQAMMPGFGKANFTTPFKKHYSL